MTPTRLYNFRIDNDLDTALKALKARDGLPESEAIRRALREYLTQRRVLGVERGAGMDTNFSADWLFKGHFDLSKQPPHGTTTLQIKNQLSIALGLPKGNGLQVASFPVGPQKRHTYWWRETELKYGEAQFVAQISKLYPVLSLGVAIEKGRETGAGGDWEMDRDVWDWDALVEQLPQILSSDIPAVAASSDAPVNVQFWHSIDAEITGWRTRAFSYVREQWFDRHAGNVFATADAITAYLMDLNGRKDTWVIVHFVRDLGAKEVEGMSPSAAASILLEFSGIRDRLRGNKAAHGADGK
jgi:hypothetical protein